MNPEDEVMPVGDMPADDAMVADPMEDDAPMVAPMEETPEEEEAA